MKDANSLPTVKAGILGGHFLQFRRDPIGFFDRLAALGDVSKFRLGGQRAIFVNHPDLIRDVLVTNHSKFHKGRALQRAKSLLGEGLLTSEGRFHLRQRRMMQPAFHRQKISGYALSMIDCGEKMSAGWAAGETKDIAKEMMRLTMQIVAMTLFSANVEDDADEVGKALTIIVELFDFLVLPFSEYLEKLPLPHSLRFKRAKKTLDEIIYRIIDERRKSGEEKDDLLSMLLAARDEEDGSPMTDEQIRNESLTLFLAGHETTANALTFTWYLLSQNPEAEKKFHEELDRVFPNGEIPKPEDYEKLKFTEAIFAESLRLFPPAWAIGRLAMENLSIAEYSIEKNDLILMGICTMHRDHRFWNDAKEFKPERWLRENAIKEVSNKFIYFPFGGGVRRCIGEQFAWMEGVLLLAAIARKWKFCLAQSADIKLQPMITLRPRDGMQMTIEPRTQNRDQSRFANPVAT